METNKIFNKIFVEKEAIVKDDKKKKRFKKKIRIHCISVRLNDDELNVLNTKRGRYRKGEWLRLASLGKLPPVVPSINLETWKVLSEISQKLNKIVTHLDNKSEGSSLTRTELFAVKRQISELRMHLVTAKLWESSSES